MSEPTTHLVTLTMRCLVCEAPVGSLSYPSYESQTEAEIPDPVGDGRFRITYPGGIYTTKKGPVCKHCVDVLRAMQ